MVNHRSVSLFTTVSFPSRVQRSAVQDDPASKARLYEAGNNDEIGAKVEDEGGRSSTPGSRVIVRRQSSHGQGSATELMTALPLIFVAGQPPAERPVFGVKGGGTRTGSTGGITLA